MDPLMSAIFGRVRTVLFFVFKKCEVCKDVLIWQLICLIIVARA